MPDPNEANKQLAEHVNQFGNQFNQANEGHIANYTAILIALIDKGILTQEDYEVARAKTIHLAEQEFARKRDQAEKEDA